MFKESNSICFHNRDWRAFIGFILDPNVDKIIKQITCAIGFLIKFSTKNFLIDSRKWKVLLGRNENVVKLISGEVLERVYRNPSCIDVIDDQFGAVFAANSACE